MGRCPFHACLCCHTPAARERTGTSGHLSASLQMGSQSSPPCGGGWSVLHPGPHLYSPSHPRVCFIPTCTTSSETGSTQTGTFRCRWGWGREGRRSPYSFKALKCRCVSLDARPWEAKPRGWSWCWKTVPFNKRNVDLARPLQTEAETCAFGLRSRAAC